MADIEDEEAIIREDEEAADEEEGEDFARTSEYSEADDDEDEEEEKGEDLYPLIDSEEDNATEQELYEQYLALTTEIDNQNAKITEIKQQVNEILQRPCQTAREIKDMKNMRICIEQELCKLNMMLANAMRLQNAGAPRWYGDLTISTTLDDDMRASYACFQCPAYGSHYATGSNDIDDDDCDYDDDDICGDCFSNQYN